MLGRFVPLGILGCLTVGLASLAGADGAAAAPFTLEGPPKVAMVLFGPKNDGGWGQAFEEARVRTEKALGIQIPVVDNIKVRIGALPVTLERAAEAYGLAGPTLADVIGHLQGTGDRAACGGPHHFRFRTSCSIERSSVSSATSRLSLLFSSSSGSTLRCA